MLIVAHRGLHAAAPENSHSAVEAALAAGFDRIEVDVRATADGALVLMHDATLWRTTTGRGAVSAHGLSGLRRVRLSDGSPVPLLSEVLEMCRGRAIACLDVKEPAVGLPAMEMAERMGAAVEVWSSHRAVIAAAADRGHYAGWISHGLFADGGGETLADEARQLGARAISFYPADLMPAVARRCREHGVDVMSGTPNDRKTWEFLRVLGTRAVTTDRPVECRDWLAGVASRGALA